MKIMKTFKQKKSNQLLQLKLLIGLLLCTLVFADSLKGQVCNVGVPGAFSPIPINTNETCPGASDGTFTLLGYANFVPGDYPFTYDIYINGVFSCSGSVDDNFTVPGVFTGCNTVGGLSDGDIITITTCSNTGTRGSNNLGIIGLDALLPNEPLLAPAGQAFLCNGAGSVTLSASENATGGEAWSTAMTYTWSSGETGNLSGAPVTPADLVVTATGVYNVVIDNGCTVTDPASVTVSDITVTAAATTVSAVSCFGATDGVVTVTPNPLPGAGTAYTYLWDAGAGGQTTANATGLGCGTLFNVTITETTSTCTATDAVSLTCPPGDITLTTDAIQHESCPGGCDGAVTVTASGGAGAPMILIGLLEQLRIMAQLGPRLIYVPVQ